MFVTSIRPSAAFGDTARICRRLGGDLRLDESETMDLVDLRLSVLEDFRRFDLWGSDTVADDDDEESIPVGDKAQTLHAAQILFDVSCDTCLSQAEFRLSALGYCPRASKTLSQRNFRASNPTITLRYFLVLSGTFWKVSTGLCIFPLINSLGSSNSYDFLLVQYNSNVL